MTSLPTPEGFPPDLVPTWEPLGLLGQGAMGAVFRCRHRQRGGEAALKLLHQTGGEQELRRALREAETLARLDHPGVVHILETGHLEDGTLYLALELLEGQSLLACPLPEDPVSLLLELADALEAVHDAGLVHRDVKPANVILTDTGRAVLVDFGLVHDPERTRLTATGQLAGTPAFFAPEVLSSPSPTPAMDWYALGVTFYQLLERRLPFNPEQVLGLLAGAPAPPLAFERIPGDSGLARAITALLSQEPEGRPRSRAALEQVLTSPGIGTPPPGAPLPGSPLSSPVEGRTSSKRSGALWGLAGLVCLASFLIPSGSRAPLPPEPTSAAPSPPPLAPTEVPGADPWEDCRRALLPLRQAIQRSRQAHPSFPPLLSIPTQVAEVPEVRRTHAHEAVEGGQMDFVEEYVGLLETLENSLVRLRSWSRDHPGSPSPYLHREVSHLLFSETLPQLWHLREDYILTTEKIGDPRSLSERLSPDASLETFLLKPIFEAVRNGTTSYQIFLEDWSDLPAPLLPLLTAHAPELRTGPPPLGRFLVPWTSWIRHERDPTRLGAGLEALLLALGLDHHIRDVLHEERVRVLDQVEAVLASPDLPLLSARRDHLRIRCLVERVRLSVALDRSGGQGAVQRDQVRRFREGLLWLRGASASAPEQLDEFQDLCRKILTAREEPTYRPGPDSRELLAVLDEVALNPPSASPGSPDE